MTIPQALLILRAHWRVSAVVLTVVVVLTTTVSLTAPKIYTATASVLVNSRQSDPVSGDAQPAAFLPSYMITEVDVMNSDRVAQRVVRQLRLDRNPRLVQRWKEATGGHGSPEVWMADTLQDSLDVRPSRDSNVVSISYSGTDPKFAAAIANAFANSYLETNLELRVDPARRYATWFVDRSKQLRQNLAAAQARLSAYQREKGLVGVNSFDVENARLAELSSASAAARAQSAGGNARQRQATGDMVSSPEVLGSPIVQALRTQVAQQAAELRELSSQLGPNHPQYREAQSQLGELQARLNAEMRHAASAVSAASRADAQREADLRRALEEQRRKVLAISEQRDALAVLQRDVENAQRAYETVTQRLNQSALESEIQQTEVSILTRAVEPLTPSGPNVALNIVLAVLTGAFLGVVAALSLELSDRRIRSEADLGQLENVPLLASLGLARARRGRVDWLREALARRGDLHFRANS